MKSDVKNVVTSLNGIQDTITRIEISLSTHQADITGLKVHTRYGKTDSPIIPSEEGQKLLNHSGFSAQYPKMKNKLFAIIERTQARTLYDYQIAAIKALNELRDDPLVDPLKDYAVNHPDETLEVIFDVASWVIRDDYAKEKAKHAT